MKQSNWMSSNRKQEKPKQSHARRKQRKKQFKNLAKNLKAPKGFFITCTLT